MTAAASSYPERNGESGRAARLVLVLLAVLVTSVGAIKLGTHATAKHTEAERIRRCLAEQGPLMEFEKRGDASTRCFVVELETRPCSKWAILIAQFWLSVADRCDMRERTAFMPRDGSPNEVMDYLLKTFRPVR